MGTLHLPEDTRLQKRFLQKMVYQRSKLLKVNQNNDISYNMFTALMFHSNGIILICILSINSSNNRQKCTLLFKTTNYHQILSINIHVYYFNKALLMATIDYNRSTKDNVPLFHIVLAETTPIKGGNYCNGKFDILPLKQTTE